QGGPSPLRRKRDRTRAGNRSAYRRRSRRNDPGRLRGGRGFDVHGRAADPGRNPDPRARRDPLRAGDRVTSLVAATLNIRNLADRWWERAPLLFGDMAGLQPDVIGLQEVVYPLQQDRLIGASGPGSYAALRV